MSAARLIRAIITSVRPLNLIIAGIALWLARITVVKPILESEGDISSITDRAYMLMIAATLLVAGGGYIINDFFDRGIDAVNRPGSNKTGTSISSRQSIILYVLLTILGLACSWWFGERAGIRYPVLVHVFSAGLLFFYSQSYKKMFLAGNLVISFLSALTIGLSVLFDRNAMQSVPACTIITAYVVFAFVMTLIREIIKDCEDMQGDSAFGASTLPIVAGPVSARRISAMLTLLIAGGLVWIQVQGAQWNTIPAFVYVVLCIEVPLLILTIRCLRTSTKEGDHTNATIAKCIMVTGLLSMPVLYLSSS